MTKIDNTRIDGCIIYLDKEMNPDGLFIFKAIDEDHIGAYFKNDPEHCFARFYVKVIQHIISDEEFESEGG